MCKKSFALLSVLFAVLNLVACKSTSVSPDNGLAENTEELKASCVEKFVQKTYSDSESGLSITYNLYLPENYQETETYPMLVFIGDSSCAGNDSSVSLTQGRGALVWASQEWQSVYPTIVAVPTYPVTILDDHGSYTTTEYVELTKSFIDYMTEEYAVDSNRIYGTGQSMGCMTTLILASRYPDLYAACMFVDGQWDISTLSGLENQTFVYFAAEDDTNAWKGAQEVMAMFDKDSVSYKYAQWDGNWSVNHLSAGAKALFESGENQYFISWASGSIEPKAGGMGSRTPPSGDFAGPDGSSDGQFQGPPDGAFPGPGGNSDSGMSAPDQSALNSSAYHMGSFDYAYNCIAVMEWLIGQ
ncbi:MAG: prolyl oligopeptidase family serine peptidase [Treponema sp.]|nr:prolyl oligopeptidase family serine peptidase [Treponema sp.]